MKFIKASISDISLLMDMIESFYEEDNHNYDEEKIYNALLELITHEDYGAIFLIESSNKYVGYFILSYGWSLEYFGRDAFIDEIFINKEFRGKGLGKKTINFMETYLKDKKIKTIHLEVNKYNIAKKLYESKGYITHNSHLMSKKL